MRVNFKTIFSELKSYFNLMADKEDERQVVEQVSAGVVFRGTNLWILIFAILIASLGLNVNSTAVIIGAMLISPLMGPIIGMGLAVGIGDFYLFRRALKNYAVATLISIVTAALYFLLSPLGEAQSELLARTSPTLFDVLIAFCGGAAGVLALTTKSKGQVIPGVAIATALMPPLCTAGYGLATAQWAYFLGAFYLYFINTVFIAISTFLGVKLLRFHTVQHVSAGRIAYGRRVLTVVVVLTLIPAAVMTFNIIQRNIQNRNINAFVEHELHQSGTQILSATPEHDTLRVVAVGRTIGDDELAAATHRMADYGLKGYSLAVIQGADFEDIEALTAQLNNIATSADNEKRRLGQQVADLERQLDGYTRYDSLTRSLNAEVKPLFPPVQHIKVGLLDGSPVAVIKLKTNAAIAPADRRRLDEWLRARTDDPALETLFQ